MSNERLRGISIHRPIVYGNTSVLLTPEERKAAHPDHTHRWTVCVRSAASPPDGDQVGGADDISYFVKRVTFKLHETYPQPNRVVDKPPFEVSETGWGEFEVMIRIGFVPESVEKPLTVYHHIKLHAWATAINPNPDPSAATEPIHAWQYDEIVFNDPYPAFYNTLLANPPTPLPKIKKRAVPPHTAYAPSIAPATATRGPPEFTSVMEQEELERLEQAKKEVIQQTASARTLLAEKENELAELKRLLNERGVTS